MPKLTIIPPLLGAPRDKLASLLNDVLPSIDKDISAIQRELKSVSYPSWAGNTPTSPLAGPTYHASRRSILKRQLDDIEHQRRALEKEVQKKYDDLADIDSVKAWLGGELKLEAPQHSVMHQCMDNLNFSLASLNRDSGDIVDVSSIDNVSIHSLMMTHDWAAVLGDHPDTQGEWDLPYDMQCFEFQVSGLRVCAFVSSMGVMVDAPAMFLTIRSPAKCWFYDGHWIELLPDHFKLLSHGKPFKGSIDALPLRNMIYQQIRACSIMLDAEVAEAQAFRAHYRANKPRGDRPPLPPMSHHIVSLANRKRIGNKLPVGELHEPSRHVRLHFRRGHWRHFESHKTWIKWMLVGDPELGFVDKDYRL